MFGMASDLNVIRRRYEVNQSIGSLVLSNGNAVILYEQSKSIVKYLIKKNADDISAELIVFY